MICPEELKKKYAEGKVILFVGAGISMSVNWEDERGVQKKGVSWDEMVREAIVQLGYQDPRFLRCRGTDLQILEYYKAFHSNEIAKLTNWMIRNHNPPDKAILDSAIHREIVNCNNCKLIYTTNYDDFLERAFYLNGRTARSVAIEQEMGNSGEETQIIKFHGDFDHPGQIVMSESEYEKRLGLATPMDIKLRADLLGRVILFIGYSFRDPNVSYLFRIFTESLIGQPMSSNRAFIAFQDPSEFEMLLFNNRKMEIISISGNSIAEDVTKLLSEMRGV